MSDLRKFGILAFGLAVIVGVSACQKKQEQTQTSATDTTQTSAESPFPVEETPPAANAPPAATPATGGGHETRTTAHKTTGSTSHATSGTTTAKTTLHIPAGTTVDLVMVSDASTKTSNIGDAIEAKLTAPLVVDGKVVAEEGSHVRGSVSDVKRASRSKGEENRASLKFNFTTLETVGGDKTINATVTNSEGKELEAEGTGTRDKLLIGGGTVAGAIIGKVAGKSTKSTILGALGGAAVGAGVVMAAKGHELEVPAGAKVALRIEDPVTVVMAK